MIAPIGVALVNLPIEHCSAINSDLAEEINYQFSLLGDLLGARRPSRKV
jgi:hypothetical protein